MVTIALIGRNSEILDALQDAKSNFQIVLFEEPSIIQKKGEKIFHPIIQKVIPLSYQKVSKLGCEVFDEFSNLNISLIFPGLEYAVPASIILSNKLNLPNLGQHLVNPLGDKYQMRNLLNDCFPVHFRQPKYWTIVEFDQLKKYINDEIEQSFILKPANRQASLGVSRVDGESDLLTVWKESTELDEMHKFVGRDEGNYCILEQLVVGNEYSCEVVIHKGRVQFLNVTKKHKDKILNLVEMGHSVPSPDSDYINSAIEAAATELVKLLDMDTGFIHSEWIVDEEGVPNFIECAGRPAGDSIMTLIGLSYDMNFYEFIILIMLGHVSHRPERRCFSMNSFFSSEAGIIRSIEGLDELKASFEEDIIHSYDISKNVGDSVETLKSSWGRIGSFITSGENVTSVQSATQKILEIVKFNTGN